MPASQAHVLISSGIDYDSPLIAIEIHLEPRLESKCTSMQRRFKQFIVLSTSMIKIIKPSSYVGRLPKCSPQESERAQSAGGVPIRDTSSSSSSSSSSLCGPDERVEEEEEEEPSSDQGTGVTGSALGGQKHINSRETWQNFWDLGLGFGIWIRDLGFGDMVFGTVELSMGYTILELTRAH
jgi:hypothetical protein